MEYACLLQYVAKAACSCSIICVCVPSREGARGEGCRCRWTERAKEEESVDKRGGGGGGVDKMRECMTESRQRHYGREQEEDTDRGKTDRQMGEWEKYEEEEDKSLLCCRDFHTHFRMQLVVPSFVRGTFLLYLMSTIRSWSIFFSLHCTADSISVYAC